MLYQICLMTKHLGSGVVSLRGRSSGEREAVAGEVSQMGLTPQRENTGPRSSSLRAEAAAESRAFREKPP